MRIAFAAAAAAALLLPVASSAQPATITEAEFLAPDTAAEHPALVALREELAGARAAVVGARTLPDPELEAVREDPAGPAVQLDLTVAWRPPRPGSRRLAIGASQARLLAAEARLAGEVASLRAELRGAFARWAVESARAERLADLAARLDELATRERRRAEAGEASGLAARRFALAAGGARRERGRAEAEAAAAAAVVRGWRPELPSGVRPALPPLPAMAQAMPESARVAALEADLEAARLERQLAGKVIALPAVIGGWQRQETPGASVEGPIVGLAWQVPLFDRNRAARAAAASRVEALTARLALAGQQVEAERQAAIAAYERLRAGAIEAASAATEAEPAVTAASAAFRLGEATVTDLLETLRAASDAEVAALELHAEALAAHRELERLASGAANPAIQRETETTDEESP